MTQPSANPSNFFLECCTRSIGAVLKTALELDCTARIDPEIKAPEQRLEQAFAFRVNNGMSGRFDILLSLADALKLVRRFTRDDETQPWSESQDREALEELLRQIAGELASMLRPKHKDITVELDSGATAAEDFKRACILTEANQWRVPFWIGLSPELPGAGEGNANDAPANAIAIPQTSERNLQFLMDVNLQAMLRFGRKTMSLKEVLELDSGAVIELDRMVNDPADLLVGGKLVARGEVVIINGSFGLRVTELFANHSTVLQQTI